MLPKSIRLTGVASESPDFHARYSSKTKTYLYKINTGQIQLPTERLYTVHVPFNLNMENMKNCLQIICGTYDFSSFEASGSRDKTKENGRGAIRTILRAVLKKAGPNTYHFEITGDGFLRHMIRNFVGTILEVGKNKRTVDEFKEILEAKDRSAAGPTAPAHGLHLMKIFYN